MMEGLAFQADKALLDTVFDGVVVIDLKTLGITLANKAAASILGFDDPEQLIGTDPLHHIPREDHKRVGTLLASTVSGICLQDSREVRILDNRGRGIWIMARGIKLASNGTSVLLASFRDITAQKLADMALREAERKQLELLNISNEWILISQDWKIVFANRRLQEALGLSGEALAGMSILDMVHPDDRQAATERYQEIMDGGFTPSDKAFKGIGKDGKPRWGVLREVPFTWQGRPAIMTLIQDVTEQRTAEEALRFGEERYRHLLENANESVLIIQDWKVAYVNRKFEEIIGIPRQSLAGLHILDLTHPDDRQAVSERYQKIVNGEKYSSGAPLRGIDKDGRIRWAEVREIPFIWEGKPAVMSMMVDITDRKQAEEALHESERKYRLVAENASDVIWTADMDFNVTYMSPSAARLLRCSVEEAKTLTVVDMLTPESLELGMRAFQQQLDLEAQEGANLQREWKLDLQLQRLDGSTVWVEEKVNFIRDAQHQPIGIMGITRDITERKAAEKAISDSEKKYRQLIETLHEGIWVIDKEANTTFVNPRMAEILGYSQDEMIGKPLLSFMDETSVAIAKQNLDRRQRGVKERHDFEFLRKDGTRVYASLETSPILDSDGRYAGAIAGVQDVTERRKVEEALRESEQRYRLMAENMTDVIWALDMNLKTIYVSPSVMHQRGYTVEEAMSLPLEQQMSPETMAQIKTAILEELKLEETGNADPHRCRTAEGETYRKDGSKFWVEITASFLRDPQGKPVGFMGITRDITERKKARELLRASEEKYRLLTEKTADIIWTTDLTLLPTYVSPSIEKVLGFTPEERLTQKVEVQMTPASFARVQACLQEELRREQEEHYDPERTIRIETEYYHKNGSTVWMENLVSAIRDHEGHIVGVHGVSRDVMDRRQAEESAKLAAQEWGETFDSITDMVSIHDRDFNVIRANKAFAESLGMTLDEVKGRKCFEILHGMEAPWQDCPHQKCMTCGESGTKELWEPRLGKYLHVSVSPLFNSRNEIVGSVHIARDITERKRIENAAWYQRDLSRQLGATSDLRQGLRICLETAIVMSGMDCGGAYLMDRTSESLNLVFETGLSEDFVKSVSHYQLHSPSAQIVLAGKPVYTVYLDLKVPKDEARQREGLKAMAVIPFSHDGQVLGCLNVASHTLEEIPNAAREWLETISSEASAAIARLNLQEKLGDSERRYRLLAENVNDVIYTTDLRLNLTYVSSSVAKLLGYTTEEVLQTGLDKLVTPASLEAGTKVAFELLANEAAEEPGSWTIELELKHKDKGTIWVEVTTNFMRGQDGQAVGLIGVVRDISERKRVQDALRDSEAKYRNLFENTQTAMEVISGETGLVVLANQATARTFGFASPDDLIGIDSMEYLMPEDRDRVVSQMAQALMDKNWNQTAELRVRTRDGRILWISGMVTHTEYQGKPALLVSLIDLTSRKEAELKVTESEEKNRLLIDNAAEGIAVVQDGLLKFVNPKCAEFTGQSAEGLLSAPFLDIVHPEDRQMMAENHARRLSGDEAPNNYQFRIVDQSGNTKWLQINAVQFDWEGRPATLSMLTDVTERKRAEGALRDSENRYRLIAENASDVIWTMDLDLRMTYVSPSIEKLTGYSVEESISMRMEDGLTPASLETAAQVYSQGLTVLERNGGSPTSPVAVELEMKCKDGSTVWTEVQMSFMQDSEGKVVGIMGVARNVDERRRARKAMEESEERFRALIEGARDAIAVIDLKGRVTYRSPSAERITDGVLENLLSTSLQERLHPDDVAKATSIFESLMKAPDGSVVDVELRYRRDDESWGVIEARGTNLVHDPKISGIVVNYRDITERRQAEEAFRESESRYRLLAENVSDVIWSLNLKSRRSFFSPSVTRLLGYTVEEATSLKMTEIVAPTSYPKAMMAFSKLSAQQSNGSDGRVSSMQLDLEMMRKDGSVVWVDVSVTLVRDAEGQPAEVFGVIRDVTRRKEAEEALRTSEEYFRTLIENAWDAIVIVNAEGTMLYESPSSARIMGYEPEEIVGKNLTEFVRPEDITANVDMFRRFRTEPGSTVMIDAGFRHKDGHYIECEGTLQNLLHDPKINGIVANWRDVTDRRRAEEAILASEERFRNLVEATSDWVWEADPNGIYTYASSKACEVLGYEVSEIVGKSIFDFMPSRESNRFARTFKSHAEKREPFAFLETSRQRKDGKVIVMETSGVPFFASDGTLLGYRGIGRDITNRKNIERELERSVKKLEKTMEATIQAISYTMETRDPYTTGHQKRVTQLACAIAKEMGVAAWQIDGIRVAGLLHDIGKIAVPTEILSKPGKLSDIEFSMIKSHPKVGFDILKNVEFEWPIARIVVQHHERLDGSGYPYGIRGRDILQEARVLAVADVVEAMSSHRPYRAALGIEKALAEVARGEGTLYDPDVVRACAKVITERGFKFES